MLRRILVPVDFSPASACAVAIARDYRPEDATVRLIHIISPSQLANDAANPRINPMHAKEVRTDAEQAANTHLRSWAQEDEEIAVEIGKAAEKISAHANHWQADMIAMGTGSRSGLSHFLHDSATEWLVRHAKQPVLAVHEVDLDAEQRAHLPNSP